MPDGTKGTGHARNQAASLAVQLGGAGRVDLLVTPETWITARDLGTGTSLENVGTRAVTWIRQRGVSMAQRCLIGVNLGAPSPKSASGHRGHYVLVDSDRPERPYIKHSQAGSTAWEQDRWVPRTALPTWRGGIRPSLCQDLYFPLLAGYRHSTRQVRLIVNSAGAKFDIKHRRLIVATAIENECPVVSTWQNSGRERPYAVDARGRSLPMTPIGSAAESTLYQVDLEARGTHDAFMPVKGNGAADSRKVRISAGRARITGTDIKVVQLDRRALHNPSIWVRAHLDAGPCLFHLRVPARDGDEARRLAEARAIQLGTPTLLTYGTEDLLIERASKRKSIRTNSVMKVRTAMIASLDSVYRPLVGDAAYRPATAAFRRYEELYRKLLDTT
jgi:predicted amidohydrolase